MSPPCYAKRGMRIDNATAGRGTGSIGFIVAVQLNDVTAPRFWPFDRL